MKRHIRDFDRFSMNENMDGSDPWSDENREGLEYLEETLRGLSPCELGGLIIHSGNTVHDEVIGIFVEGLGGMGYFDEVKSAKEARAILKRWTKP